MTDPEKAAEYEELVQQLYDPRTRRAARQKLVRAKAVEPLLECLSSHEETIVWAAIKSLGELRASEAVGPLIDLLERGVLMLDVCDALTTITGQYFGSNVKRWREWLGEKSPAGSSPGASPGLDVAECIRRTGQFLGVQPDGSGNSYRFKLLLSGGRAQRVAVFFGRKDAKGEELVIIYSECGPARPKFYETVLRKNMGIPSGAFAIRDIQGKPNFVIVDTMVSASVTPSALAKKVEHIGSWADMVEKDLAKEDRR